VPNELFCTAFQQERKELFARIKGYKKSYNLHDIVEASCENSQLNASSRPQQHADSLQNTPLNPQSIFDSLSVNASLTHCQDHFPEIRADFDKSMRDFCDHRLSDFTQPISTSAVHNPYLDDRPSSPQLPNHMVPLSPKSEAVFDCAGNRVYALMRDGHSVKPVVDLTPEDQPVFGITGLDAQTGEEIIFVNQQNLGLTSRNIYQQLQNEELRRKEEERTELLRQIEELKRKNQELRERSQKGGLQLPQAPKCTPAISLEAFEHNLPQAQNLKQSTIESSEHSDTALNSRVHPRLFMTSSLQSPSQGSIVFNSGSIFSGQFSDPSQRLSADYGFISPQKAPTVLSQSSSKPIELYLPPSLNLKKKPIETLINAKQGSLTDRSYKTSGYSSKSIHDTPSRSNQSKPSGLQINSVSQQQPQKVDYTIPVCSQKDTPKDSTKAFSRELLPQRQVLHRHSSPFGHRDTTTRTLASLTKKMAQNRPSQPTHLTTSHDKNSLPRDRYSSKSPSQANHSQISLTSPLIRRLSLALHPQTSIRPPSRTTSSRQNPPASSSLTLSHKSLLSQLLHPKS